jgi:nucleotide-binding universal stress UspA family protein
VSDLRKRGRVEEWLPVGGCGRGPVVLAAVDRCDRSLGAVLVAASFAKQVGGRLVVLHVTQPSTWVGAFGYAVPCHLIDDSIRELTIQLRDRVGGLVALEGVPWSFVVVSGNPGDEIVRVADLVDAGTVVLGTPRCGFAARLAHLVHPSAAARVLRRPHRAAVVLA